MILRPLIAQIPALFLVLAPSAAWSATYTYVSGTCATNYKCQEISKKVQPGDRVIIFDRPGHQAEEYRLEAYQGGGKKGRVFRALRQDGKTVAVKFQIGGRSGRQYMVEQADALGVLRAEEIGAAELYHADTDFFLETEFVRGESLYDLIQPARWNSLSPEARAKTLNALSELFVDLLHSPHYIVDLRTRNVMLNVPITDALSDEPFHFKVVDPGLAVQADRANHGVKKLMASIKRFGCPEMNAAFQFTMELHINNQDLQWLPRFLSLQDQIRQRGASTAPPSEADEPAGAPETYRRLWQQQQHIEPVSGNPQPLRSCVFSGLRTILRNLIGRNTAGHSLYR